MIMRGVFLLGAVLVSLTAVAEESPCLNAYRNIYMYGAPSHFDQRRFNDAKQLYELYVDFTGGLSLAYQDAGPIFNALGIADSDRDELLQAVVWFMRTGILCDQDGEVFTMDEAIAVLKKKFVK
jgi:hypothetical protein